MIFKKKYFAHESAHIDDGVEIGEGTKIWHNVVIRKGAVIGKNCTICQGVYIDENVVIGDRCKIKNNALLFTGVKLNYDVFIGPGVVFTNVINPRAFIERKHEFKATFVEQGATIGANATIVCGIEIGEYAMIGAGSVVTHSVGKNALFYGNPGKFKGYVNSEGNKCKFSEIC